jgi:hypothetical protein
MSFSNGWTGADITALCTDATGITTAKLVYQDTTNSTHAQLAVLAATGETTKPLGITVSGTSSAADNLPCVVRINGIALLTVDGSGTAIDNGDSICATTAGVGVIATTPDAAQQWAIGYAMAPSAASGDIIPVLIDRHLIVKGTA